MDWGLIGGISGIVSLALVVFAGGRYVGKLDALVRRHEACPIVRLEREVAVLTAKTDIWWRTVEETIPHRLIAPHTARRDDLLGRMSRHELQPVDAAELLADLQPNLTEFPPDSHLAVVLLIARLKLIANGLG